MDVWLTWHAPSSSSVAYRAARARVPLATRKDLHYTPKRAISATPGPRSPPRPANPNHLGQLEQWHWLFSHLVTLFSQLPRAAALEMAKGTWLEVRVCTL